MAQGNGSDAARRALDAVVYAALLTFHPGDNRGTAVMAEALDQLDTVTQELRLVPAPGWCPGCCGSSSRAVRS